MRPAPAYNKWLNICTLGLYNSIVKCIFSIKNSITKVTRFCIIVFNDVMLPTSIIMVLTYLHAIGIFSLGIVPLVMLSFLINGIRSVNNNFINQGVYNVRDCLLPIKELCRGLLRTIGAIGADNNSRDKQMEVSYIYSAIFISSYFVNTGLFGLSSIFWVVATTIIPFAIESVMNNSVNINELNEISVGIGQTVEEFKQVVDTCNTLVKEDNAVSPLNQQEQNTGYYGRN